MNYITIINKIIRSNIFKLLINIYIILIILKYKNKKNRLRSGTYTVRRRSQQQHRHRSSTIAHSINMPVASRIFNAVILILPFEMGDDDDGDDEDELNLLYIAEALLLDVNGR